MAVRFLGRATGAGGGLIEEPHQSVSPDRKEDHAADEEGDEDNPELVEVLCGREKGKMGSRL